MGFCDAQANTKVLLLQQVKICLERIVQLPEADTSPIDTSGRTGLRS